MGFIEETGAAQHYRDARVAQIYEGTNGIQAIDLVTRKLPMAGGAVVRLYLDDLRRTVGAVGAVNDPAFGATGKRLAEAVESLAGATDWTLAALASSPDAALAGATTYLRLFASAAGGCMLAEEALAASRHADLNGAGDKPGRIAIARFFAENLAAQAPALARIVTEGSESVLTAGAGIGAS
jgi:acyl-CoA dehydrogenase